MNHSVFASRRAWANPRAMLAAAAMVGTALSSQAAVVTFGGMTDSGPSIGASFSGKFSYEDVAAGYDGSVDLTSFLLEFQGRTYSLAAADQAPLAQFLGGDFLGVDYSSFADPVGVGLTAGFNSVDQSFFSYSNASGAGFGDVTFAAVSAVPEPASLVLAMLGLGLLGVVVRRRG